MFNMTSLKENLAKSSKPNTVKLKWSGKPGKQRSLAQSYSLKKNLFKQKRTHLTREQQHYECALLSDTESKYVWDNFIEKVDMDQNERKTIKTHLRRLSWTDSPSKLTFQLQFHLINESHRKRNVVWTREICEELKFLEPHGENSRFICNTYLSWSESFPTYLHKARWKRIPY